MAVGGDNISRVSQGFVKDHAIENADQASDNDFIQPYDQGHMTPANDAPDDGTQRDTFVFTNAVPQDYRVNRYLWKSLEGSLHQVAENEGDIYIVTGPIFAAKPHLEHGRVARPKSTFKAVYIPARNLAVGYIAKNGPDPDCRAFPIAELVRQSGVDPFPALSEELKAAHSSYPLPQSVNVMANGTRQHFSPPHCH